MVPFYIRDSRIANENLKTEASFPNLNASVRGWHSGSACPLKSMAYTRHTPFHSVKRRRGGQNEHWTTDSKAASD
jgi:hypothetical protein